MNGSRSGWNLEFLLIDPLNSLPPKKKESLKLGTWKILDERESAIEFGMWEGRKAHVKTGLE